MTRQKAAELCSCHISTIGRYISTGDLKATKIGKEYDIKKKDLNKVMQEIRDKQDKFINNYNPTSPKPSKTLDLPEPTEHKEDLLDDNGKAELLRVTEILREEGIIDKTHTTLLFKYAFFQQKVIHYMQLIDDDDIEEEDKYHITKSLDQFQKFAVHYEKELLISTASRLKVFPPEVKKEISSKPVDEFMGVDFAS